MFGSASRNLHHLFGIDGRSHPLRIYFQISLSIVISVFLLDRGNVFENLPLKAIASR